MTMNFQATIGSKYFVVESDCYFSAAVKACNALGRKANSAVRVKGKIGCSGTFQGISNEGKPVGPKIKIQEIK